MWIETKSSGWTPQTWENHSRAESIYNCSRQPKRSLNSQETARIRMSCNQIWHQNMFCNQLWYKLVELIHIYIYIHIQYIYIWLLIKIPLSRNGHSSRIKILLSRNFRELHVYLSRSPCWPTTPLMKIRSPPAKLRQRITDHFLVAF